MNLADLPPLPPGSRILIESAADGIKLTFPQRAGPLDYTILLLSTVGALIVAHWFIGELISAPGLAPTPFFLGMVTLGGLLHAWTRIFDPESIVIMRIAPGQLFVELQGVFRTTKHTWERAQLRTVGAWRGLHIQTRGESTKVVLLKRRESAEQRYVAGLIRDILGILPQQTYGPSDLAVTYTGAFWDEPEEGVLHVEPGRMTLAHPMASKPHLKFMAGGGLFRCWWFNATIPLSPDDLLCRLETEGTCRLEIAPAQVLACKGSGGVPRIDLAPLGRVFTLSCDLHGCQATRLPHRAEELRLILRCDDPEALPRAVARFWGNREE